MNKEGKDLPSGGVRGIDDVVSLYVGALRSMIEATPAGAGEPGTGSRQEILLLLAKAQVTWLTSGLRYWRQIGEIVGRNGLGLIDAATRASTVDADADENTARTMRQLVLIDRARACLREVGEASLSEAATLRRELQKIEQDLRATQDPGPGPQGKRTWRTKP